MISINPLIKVILTAVLIVWVSAGWTPATASEQCPSPGGSAGTVSNGLFVGMSCTNDGGLESGLTGASASVGVRQYEKYVWVSVCQRFDPASPDLGPIDCGAARACDDPVERVWALWGLRTGATWEPLGTQCFGRPPTVLDTPEPTVTPALVLTALRRIGLPAIAARTQPEGKTLINFDTIFFAEPKTFSETITLLGQRVDVEAAPAQFTWIHGDGTFSSTETPGAPYPAKDVVHQYTDAHKTVQTRVDVTYQARFSVNGGNWQAISEPVTISGPTDDLRISEATAVLSGQYD